MKLGTKQEFELSSPIINIRPVSYSLPKIASIIAIIPTICILLHFLSDRCIVLFLITIFFAFTYLNITNHSILLYLFYLIEEEDNEGINKYVINDLSYRTENDQNSRKTNHIFIVKIHYTKNEVKYFHFKEQLYKIQNNTVSSINQSDILRLFEINDFKQYLRYGLSDGRMKTSIELFKIQSKLLKPTALDFIKKRIFHELQLILLNGFLFCVVCFVIQSILVSIILGIVNVLIIVMIIHNQSKKVEKFRSKFTSLTSKDFPVYRQGRTLRVPLSEILVGDIIEIEKLGLEDEYMTCFRSLLIGNFQIICKEGANREEFIKSPVREVTDVTEDRKIRFVIKPLSYIEKGSLRGNEHLIVMQNNSISKFFSLWFLKSKYAEFYSISGRKLWRSFKLYAYGIGLLILLHVVFSIFNHTFKNFYNEDTLLAILTTTFLIPSLIHLLFCFSHHKCMNQLEQNKIEVFGANLAQAGVISNILINFSELLQLQFQQILYKNLIFDPSSRQFQPDEATLQNGRTYESLLALILYISMGYFDLQDNKLTFLREIYKLFESYYQIQDTLDDNKIIVHKSSERRWNVVHKDLQNQSGLRSWRIQYDHLLKYVVTEFNIHNQQNFLKYIGTEDQNRMAIYTSLAENLMEEGKKIKLIMFKSFKLDKEGANLRESEMLAQSSHQFIQVEREKLEHNMEFAAFIIFDNALKTENQKIIEFLRDMTNQNKNKTFNLSVYSHSKNQNLAGFQHILQYIPIHYALSSNEKTSLIREKMHEGGSIVVGNDIDDNYGELVSDLSIRITEYLNSDTDSQKMSVPADIFIEKLENLREIFSVGMVHAQFMIEVIKYAFIVWFWMIFGWVYVGSLGKDHSIKDSQLWSVVLTIMLIFIPLLVKILLDHTKQMSSYRIYHDQFTFPFISQLLLSAFISILAIIIIVIQFDVCKAQSIVASTHMLSFRMHNQVNQHLECINLPMILSGLGSVLTFTIFFGEENCGLNNFEWWRFFLPLVWFTLMIIDRIPFQVILLCGGFVVFLIFIKLLIKLIGPSSQEKSLKESQNASTEIE